ncbi:hypothetical protein NO357_03240 [Marimonas arenosa]|uniref:Uncharacterized protein n=1 Tax=Marimonas arenosa TaxID=1795305 RepID=A0AAE3W9N1_9RHOB|nr:hypothetical protein [Marimonas arenosa]
MIVQRKQIATCLSRAVDTRSQPIWHCAASSHAFAAVAVDVSGPDARGLGFLLWDALLHVDALKADSQALAATAEEHLGGRATAGE